MLNFIAWAFAIASILISHFGSVSSDYLFAIYLSSLAFLAWVADIAVYRLIKELKGKG